MLGHARPAMDGFERAADAMEGGGACMPRYGPGGPIAQAPLLSPEGGIYRNKSGESGLSKAASGLLRKHRLLLLHCPQISAF